jgi:hypothetical protein
VGLIEQPVGYFRCYSHTIEIDQEALDGDHTRIPVTVAAPNSPEMIIPNIAIAM